ncbi:hypothetical protein P8605_04780 [Streptomyces sp. T-3]|nr:hypothetical protein [Streptomyces sp. T-3]
MADGKSIMATHRSRLAKDIAALTGLPYQKALAFVTAQADAGWLPDRLDEAGMKTALSTLLQMLQ